MVATRQERQYGSGSLPAAKQELVAENLWLVRYWAGRLSGFVAGDLDYDDLVGIGAVGLLTAADRFDPAQGVLFTTFASKRIRGAILDQLRRSCWIPRSIWEKLRLVEKVFGGALPEGLDRKSVAAAAKLTEKEVEEVYQAASRLAMLSLDDFLSARGREELRWGDTVEDSRSGPEQDFLDQENLAELARGIERLNEKERLTVTLYYYEELTLKEIGLILGVSESRVSQIHGRALTKLRVWLGAEGG